MLASARRDMDAEDYASANNRAYYAIFHAMRAVLALDGEDYKTFSGYFPFCAELPEAGDSASGVREIGHKCFSDSKSQ